MTELIQDLKYLQQYFQKESVGYAKLANIPDCSKPEESTPEMRGCAYSSATYRLCAKMLGDVIEKFEK